VRGVTGTRLLSLDVFRGLTVAAMVLVNNPGTWKAIYPPLRHAEWHGWTFTDLIFPAFLFIVGAAIPFALAPRLARGERVWPRIVRRAAAIFVLGLLLHAIPSFDLATLRIPGVLQRIAVCYLVAAGLFAVAGRRALAIIGVAALLGYWAAMTLVPVPGFGPGDLGKEGNLAAWLDRAVLGPAHLWKPGRVFDPEGILSSVPAVATTLGGVLAGLWLRAPRPPGALAAGLAGAGGAAAALGLLWGLWFPINKSLWTSSYALLTAGISAVALAACYWVIEIRRVRIWTQPFQALGVNALAVFFLSTLLARLLVIARLPAGGGASRPAQAVLFEAWFAPWAPVVVASLLWAVANVALWTLLAWPLLRRGVSLRV
jgi:predicted acyltransferase